MPARIERAGCGPEVWNLAKSLVGDVIRGEAEAVNAKEDMIRGKMNRLWRADEHRLVRIEP
jgi:hypothetical protein